MQKVFFTIFIVLLSFESSYSQYWILFNATDGWHGHGFATFVTQDQVTGNLIGEDVGFGPVGIKKIIPWQRGRIDYPHEERDITFFVKVDKGEWDKAKATVPEWSTKTYSMEAQNCVDYLRALAGTLNNIQQPAIINPLDWLPTTYINDLKKMNSDRDFEGMETYTLAMTNMLKNETSLSDGAKMLFDTSFVSRYYTKGDLTYAQKNSIFQQLGFEIASENQFKLPNDNSEENSFLAIAQVIDLNLDGRPEVFVFWGNTYTSGWQDGQSTVFTQNEYNQYYKIAETQGSYTLTRSFSKGFPNILNLGPGTNTPTSTILNVWNGKKYVRSTDLSDSQVKAMKYNKFEDFYFAQMRSRN